MEWMHQLRDLERLVERDFKDIEDNHLENSISSLEERDLYTYERYKNNKKVLEELKSIGEDVSEAFKVLEETWRKSEWHPTNILDILKNDRVSISEDYYNKVQGSLIDMQKDGYDVSEVIRLLEQSKALTGFFEGLVLEQELEKLEKQVNLLMEENLDKGDKTKDER